MMNRAQVSAPLLEQLRRPQPRRAPRVIGEGPYPSLPAADRLAAQAARSLLTGPARQHRLQHLLLGAQQCHPRNQHRMARARHRAAAGHPGPEPGRDSPRAQARGIPAIILIRLLFAGRPGQRPAIASEWGCLHQTRSPGGERGYRYRNAASPARAPAGCSPLVAEPAAGRTRDSRIRRERESPPTSAARSAAPPAPPGTPRSRPCRQAKHRERPANRPSTENRGQAAHHRRVFTIRCDPQHNPVGSPGGSHPRAPTDSVREPLGSYGSYRPAKARPQPVTHAQWANMPGSFATSRSHQASRRRRLRSRRYFLRAQRIR